MIWADTCLIERVEKNPHKPQNYSLFMFRVGTASKTTQRSQHRLSDRALQNYIYISNDCTLEHCAVRASKFKSYTVVYLHFCAYSLAEEMFSLPETLLQTVYRLQHTFYG